MNSTIIHDSICSVIHKKCHLKSYHSDIEYHITLNVIFSVVLQLRSLGTTKIALLCDIVFGVPSEFPRCQQWYSLQLLIFT